jgi:type IX secretion system PorP/SprF family membrane protein
MNNKFISSITTFVVVLLCFGVSLNAQKIHFSQFETLAPILNPALTGLIPDEDNLRLSAIGRNQWSSFLGAEAFQTLGTSFDMRNCVGRSSNKNFSPAPRKFESPTWGLGLQFIRDESGVRSVGNISDGTFPLIGHYVSSSGSLMLPVNDKLLLSGGMRGGAQFHRLKTEHLRYDEQFDLVSGFDPDIAGEFDGQDMLTSNVFDIGGGITVLYLDEKWGGANLGVAVNQAFLPVKFQFTDDQDQPTLSRKITLHGKFSRSFLKKEHSIFSYKVKSVFQNQRPYQQWIAGADLIFQHDEGFSFSINSGLRRSRNVARGYHADAVLAGLTIDYKSFTVAFATDINVSDLTQVSNGYGAVELSLVYHWRKKSWCSPALESGCRIDGRYVNPMYF